MTDNVAIGIPSASLLPAAKYRFREVTSLQELTVPLRGEFPEGSVFSGTFDIMPHPGVVLFGVLNQALLATGNYPALSDDQLFVLSGFELVEDHITVVGRVFQFEDGPVQEVLPPDEGRFDFEG